MSNNVVNQLFLHLNQNFLRTSVCATIDQAVSLQLAKNCKIFCPCFSLQSVTDFESAKTVRKILLVNRVD